MNHEWIKRKKKLSDASAHFGDFVRYAFTPALGFVMLVGATCCVSIMAVLLYRSQPLVAVLMLVSYTGFVGMAMIFSLIGYVRYKVFKK
jgi:hypothetical protein